MVFAYFTQDIRLGYIHLKIDFDTFIFECMKIRLYLPKDLILIHSYLFFNKSYHLFGSKQYSLNTHINLSQPGAGTNLRNIYTKNLQHSFYVSFSVSFPKSSVLMGCLKSVFWVFSLEILQVFGQRFSQHIAFFIVMRLQNWKVILCPALSSFKYPLESTCFYSFVYASQSLFQIFPIIFFQIFKVFSVSGLRATQLY